MPKKQLYKENLEAFLQLSHFDWAMFYFVMGLKHIAPTVPDYKCIETFFELHGITEDDWPLDRMYSKYSSMKSDYERFKKKLAKL